jgi:hypothetical protein
VIEVTGWGKDMVSLQAGLVEHSGLSERGGRADDVTTLGLAPQEVKERQLGSLEGFDVERASLSLTIG